MSKLDEIKQLLEKFESVARDHGSALVDWDNGDMSNTAYEAHCNQTIYFRNKLLAAIRELKGE